MPKIIQGIDPAKDEETYIPCIMLVDLGFRPQGKGVIDSKLPDWWKFRPNPEPIKADPLLYVNEEQVYIDARCYFNKILDIDERPISVIQLDDGKYCVEDGWHRLAAAIYREEETIMAYVADPREGKDA